jgi:signal-transduction protein with cAMP-binding, CBS, and nucleotidyltransferase domain
VLSIRHDVRARSTSDRLQGIAAKGVAAPETVQAILDAHRAILGAVIGQQLVDTQAGVPLSPRVDLGRFDKAAKARLKAALLQVDEAVGIVSEGRI